MQLISIEQQELMLQAVAVETTLPRNQQVQVNQIVQHCVQRFTQEDRMRMTQKTGKAWVLNGKAHHC